jgi:hypothetical protein
MKAFLFLIFLCVLQLPAQPSHKAVFMDLTTIQVKDIFGVDVFGTAYYTTDDNTFHKRTKDTTITYTNFQLGSITRADIFNPLKINLFYQDFNTVVVLDNRLAEIFKVDFNTVIPYKNVTFISTGFDNTLWIFNQDLQQLELFDFKTNKIRLKTVPIQSDILDLKSDYNYCYMLTEKYLYIYNYFGSLVEKYDNTGYDKMAYSESQLVLKKDNTLYVKTKNSLDIKPIVHPNLLINQFLVTNESLYIYNDGSLSRYQLKHY